MLGHDSGQLIAHANTMYVAGFFLDAIHWAFISREGLTSTRAFLRHDSSLATQAGV